MVFQLWCLVDLFGVSWSDSVAVFGISLVEKKNEIEEIDYGTYTADHTADRDEFPIQGTVINWHHAGDCRCLSSTQHIKEHKK